MARVRINLPERFDFSTEILIRVDDINAGAHLSYDRVLIFAQEARTRFLAQWKYTEGNIEGRGLITADAAISYKSQGFYGQTLKVEVAVSDFARRSFDFVYRITETGTDTEIARVKTGMVFFDYGVQKSVDVPAGFKALFGEAVSRS